MDLLHNTPAFSEIAATTFQHYNKDPTKKSPITLDLEKVSTTNTGMHLKEAFNA
jgi:hypothetical protein